MQVILFKKSFVWQAALNTTKNKIISLRNNYMKTIFAPHREQYVSITKINFRRARKIAESDN
jgi:hypothetical protein